MNILTNKEYLLLPEEERNIYLCSYLEHLLTSSITACQSSDNYKCPSWPYQQAERLGSQKLLNKLLKLIK